MRIVRYDAFEGIDRLWIDEASVPDAAPGHVVVQVRAACINPGSVSALRGAPFVPIRDIAGMVVNVGQGVHGVTAGDEVLGWLQEWAAHAECVTVPVDQLIPKPSDLPWDVAGSLFVTPMAGLAAVRAVKPEAGEVVVVAGASGGVGLTAVQLSRLRGATVIGIASRDNGPHLVQFGAAPVAYDDDVGAGIREAAPDGVDAMIDAFGSGYLNLATELGVSRERIATVVDYRTAQDTGIAAVGTMNAGGSAALIELADLASSGELRIPVAAVYPLAEVQTAYRKLIEDRPFGRVVLHPQE